MMKFKTALILATVLAAVPQLAHAQEGDAAAGEKVFKKCQACHTASEEKNKVGPLPEGGRWPSGGFGRRLQVQ